MLPECHVNRHTKKHGQLISWGLRHPFHPIWSGSWCNPWSRFLLFHDPEITFLSEKWLWILKTRGNGWKIRWFIPVHHHCLFDALLANWLRSTSLDNYIWLMILSFMRALTFIGMLSSVLCPSRIQLGIQSGIMKAYLRHLMCGGSYWSSWA